MAEVRTLGDYIAARRTQLRLKQEEVSDRLKKQGVDRAATTIANWEGNRQAVPMELIPAIAKALEDSPVRLYELAGVLSELPGREIVKLLIGLPDEDVARIERMVRAYLEDT